MIKGRKEKGSNKERQENEGMGKKERREEEYEQKRGKLIEKEIVRIAEANQNEGRKKERKDGEVD